VSISLILGGTSVINGWDYPTYLLLAAGCVAVILMRYFKHHNAATYLARPILMALGFVALLVLLSRLFFWPFYQHFTPQVKASNLRFVAAAQRTELKYFLIIYGLFLWGILLFVRPHAQALLHQWKFQRRASKLVFWNALLLTIIIVYLLGNTWVIPIAGVLAVFFAYLLYIEGYLSPSPQQSAILPYLLIVMVFAIIAGCEVVYIKDFYGHPLERQNTIFKFYYQAWIFLSIGTPYLLARFFEHAGVQHKRLFRLTGRWGLVLLCTVCAIYPVFATYERAAHFRSGQQGGLLYLPTLNGLSYMAYRYPQEYEALMWIQDNLPENAIILEATGKPYSFFGRVSSVTGRSTVLGWGNHEALWRDQTWQSITQRTDDIKKMYEALDKSQVSNLLRTYEVDYVYLGKLERESYAAEGLSMFEKTFPIAYQNAFVTIYRVPEMP
jgi:YYY domain-containing protein